MSRALLFVALVATSLVVAACGTQRAEEPRGVPTDVPTVAAEAVTEQPAVDPLANTRWALTALNGQAPITATAVTLNFGGDGSIDGSDGCNRYMSSYSTAGATLTITAPIAATMMACPESIMTQASTYTAALSAVSGFEIVSGTLALTGSAPGAAPMTFAAVSEELAGTSWSALTYNDGTGAIVSVIAGTPITITFGADGQLSGFAGCNGYGGPYEAANGSIAIGDLVTEEKTCADAITAQEDAYLEILPSAVSYEIEAGKLVMSNAAGDVVATYLGGTAR